MKLYIATLTIALSSFLSGTTGLLLSAAATLMTVACGIKMQFEDSR